MNAEGQLDTDEDVEEEAEGVPEAALGNNECNGAEGVVSQDREIDNGLGALALNSVEDDDTQDEEADQNIEVGGDDRVRPRGQDIHERDIAQGIHPAPIIPPPAPILLRRASTSSLDESSQRTSCKTNNDLFSDPLHGPSNAEGSSGHRPSYHNPNHPSRVLERLRELRNNTELCDVTLVAGGYEVRAHRALLAASSPYFNAMFTGFEEKNQERVKLVDVDPHALSILVNYVYTATVDVTEANVQTLLPAANLLQLIDVRDACCEFLAAQLHPTNALGIKSFADRHGCQDLYNLSHQYIESHFTEVLSNDEFIELESNEVANLISSDTISVCSEEKIYEAALAWVQHDPTERGKNLPQVMEHVRFPLLSREYLVQRVDNTGDDLFNRHPVCKDYVIEALKFHLLTATMPSSSAKCLAAASGGTSSNLSSLTNEPSASLFTSPRVRPRLPVGKPKILVAIGGQAPKAIRSVEGYDFKEDKWVNISEMPNRRCRCGVAVVKGLVYAVGGFNGSLRVKTVDEYDPNLDTWTSIASMEARRSTLGVAVLNNRIYAVGGFDGSTGLNTAEVLDLSSVVPTQHSASAGASRAHLEWRSIANMSTRRSSVGVGVLCGVIYAVGGYDGNSRMCLSSVEVYNPNDDVWVRVADMSSRRSGAGVGVLQGQLYSVGGHDGPLVRKSVECYNPESNTWTAVAEMNYCRRNAGVVSHNGLLYVIGGDDGSSNLSSVEVYHPKNNTWTILDASMTMGRSYTGVCVIEQPDNL